MILNEIINISQVDYQKFFFNPDFGLILAKEILKTENINLTLLRVVQGSNLVFELGDNLYLKISPPFYKHAFEAEIQALSYFDSSFDYEIPKIIKHGEFENWRYLISKKVNGFQIHSVYKDFNYEDKLQLAYDLGKMLLKIHTLKNNNFKNLSYNWNESIKDNINNCMKIQLSRGNSLDLSQKISDFVENHKSKILSLDTINLTHADVNHEHIMVTKINDRWKLTGLIDFADSIIAPKEIDYVLPFLDLFKGSYSLQNNLLKGSKYIKKYDGRDFSYFLMILILQNRFIAFHNWFSKELSTGLASIEKIAETVYPYK